MPVHRTEDVRFALAILILANASLACLASPSAGASTWEVQVSGNVATNQTFDRTPGSTSTFAPQALSYQGVTASAGATLSSAFLTSRTSVQGAASASSRVETNTSSRLRLSFPAGGANVKGGRFILHFVLEGTLTGNSSLALSATVTAEEGDTSFDLTTKTGSGHTSIDDPGAAVQRREFEVAIDLLPNLYGYTATDALYGNLRLTLDALATIAPFGNAEIGTASRGRLAGFRIVNAAGAQVSGFALAVDGTAIAELPAGQATAYEYHNPSLKHYFLTHVTAEIANLDAGVTVKGWVRTGQSFPVYTTAGNGTSPVCRFYIPPGDGDSHFLGRGVAECTATAQAHPSFVNEDPQFFHSVLPSAGTCPAGTREVYRVFNNIPGSANHRYLVDKALRDQMVETGWVAEGDGPNHVVMCLPAND